MCLCVCVCVCVWLRLDCKTGSGQRKVCDVEWIKCVYLHNCGDITCVFVREL